MMEFTSLNIEQNLARYLADRFTEVGYRIFWWDTKQTEGTEGRTLTIVRDFPEDPAFIVHQSESQEDHLIRVPAFAVQTFREPTADHSDRLGIGESVFSWRAGIRVDGFADHEKEWYDIASWFRQWFNPDVRITLRDYHADLTNNDPAPSEQYIELEDVDIFRSESRNATPAATRYYVTMTAMATYTE